jgi:Ca2+-binding RTX toxin-like protein
MLVAAAGTTQAQAALSCAHEPGARPTLRVLLTKSTSLRLEVVGVNIQVQDIAGIPVACDGGPAMTTNTDAIRITATGHKPNGVTVETPSAYAPGIEDEGAGDPDEIELRVDLGRARDLLALLGDSTGEQITIGANGVNTNAADTGSPDVDLVVRRVERLRALTAAGNDDLSGAGGAGTGDAYARPLDLDGGNGEDDLAGGSAGDDLAAGLDADEMRGGRGDDLLIGAPGDDGLFGGAGADRLSGSADGDLLSGGTGIDWALYSSLNGPEVIVDIGVGEMNDGGSEDGPEGDRDNVMGTVENLAGEDEIDVFTGSESRNVLFGGAGADSLFGLSGKDRLLAKDGAADTAINCGSGRDEARFDRGLDPPRVSC